MVIGLKRSGTVSGPQIMDHTMKLSTLLLSSAAFLVAGAAYAADLPAKKMAPAAATGCTAFGAGYIAIPGSDTCLKISGYVAYEASVSNNVYGQDGYGRVGFDASSNSEIGAIHSFTRFNAWGAAVSSANDPEGGAGSTVSSDRAYIEFAGFQAGLIDSITDIGGTQSWWGANGRIAGGGFTTAGINYTAKFGNTSLTVGEENSEVDQAADAPNRPDLIAKLSTSAGGFSANVAGVSHTTLAGAGGATGNGYAILAQAQYKTGAFGLIAFGGSSQGALKYTSPLPGTALGSGAQDYDGTNYSKGTNFGGAINATFGNNVVEIAVEQTQATAASQSQVNNTYVDVWGKFPVAKALSVQPEFISQSGSASSNTGYLFIVRDF